MSKKHHKYTHKRTAWLILFVFLSLSPSPNPCLFISISYSAYTRVGGKNNHQFNFWCMHCVDTDSPTSSSHRIGMVWAWDMRHCIHCFSFSVFLLLFAFVCSFVVWIFISFYRVPIAPFSFCDKIVSSGRITLMTVCLCLCVSVDADARQRQRAKYVRYSEQSNIVGIKISCAIWMKRNETRRANKRNVKRKITKKQKQSKPKHLT